MKMAELVSEENAEMVMHEIGVDKAGIKLMLPKSKFRLLRLFSVRNAMANIIKQEILSIGGEAAVHWQTCSCCVERTDVLLMGTLKHYRQLAKKMRAQPAEGKELAGMIEKAVLG